MNIKYIDKNLVSQKINPTLTSKIDEIIVLETVDSTNNFFKTIALESQQKCKIVFAKKQTQGRGKLEKSWFSLPNKDLTMSIAIPKADRNLAIAPIISCVAVQRALESFGVSGSKIKWPNDILLFGKKICGILCESFNNSLIVGIGLNVNSATFDSSIQDKATSLCVYFGEEVDLNLIAAKILNELLALISTQNQPTFAFTKIIEEYKKKCAYIGKQVVVCVDDKLIKGRFADIDEKGLLILATTKGELIKLYSGYVSLALQY